jgi:hypothetical protein
VEERRPLGRQPKDHNFGSLIVLAVTAGAFLLVAWVAYEGAFLCPPGVANSLKAIFRPEKRLVQEDLASHVARDLQSSLRLPF